MSRIGRKHIAIPAGVEVKVNGHEVTVKGPKGTLTNSFNPEIGIEVKDGWTNKEIANKLIENGLLVLTAGPSMRLLPPLVISQEEMDQGLEILKKTLS